MQKASAAYKKAMKQPIRNRAYINARIGIVSSVAQNNVVADWDKNGFAYFTNNTEPFKENSVERRYATCEQDFSYLDGSMYFLPPEGSNYEYYNNGLVTNELLGSIYIDFDGAVADIKGVTIDFGEYYPTSLDIEYDGGTKSYSNASRTFVTEDTFDAITYMVITPKTLVNGQGRLRIEQFTCGISNTFTNKQVKSYSYKEYVSAISESLPSHDMTLTVDNQNLYYNPDSQESAITYMEQGQKMYVRFGYDVTGNGDIEWLPDTVALLKSWSATDKEAKFTLVDVFDMKLNETYYRGQYRENGISLYDLAVDVFEDAGFLPEEYSIDPYLKTLVVKNPMPVVRQSEALQIIANAGRCILSADRSGKVRIFNAIVPNMEATSDDQTEFSIVGNILSGQHDFYAMASKDFSSLDGTMLFLPKTETYLSTIGYVSNSVADEEGNFTNNPVVTITLEASATFYRFTIQFQSTAPREFKITTYYQGTTVQEITVQNEKLLCEIEDELSSFDEMTLEFTKGYPNARVAIDNILFGDTSDYSMDYNIMKESPDGIQEEKVSRVEVVQSLYGLSDKVDNIFQEKVDLTEYDTYTFYFSNASYEIEVKADGTVLPVIGSSSYYATVDTKSLSGEHELTVTGKAYVVTNRTTAKTINSVGVVKSWENPLISDDDLAKKLAHWLGNYYENNISYNITYAGEPRIDSGDIVLLENKIANGVNARIYEHELSFNGAFSGTAKAHKNVTYKED